MKSRKKDTYKQSISVVIMDLDNTLYDWVALWHASFEAMLTEVVNKSGVKRETLLSECKKVYQQHGTAEYAFLLQELPSLLSKHSKSNILQEYDSAIHAYRSARKSALKLYPQVKETLLSLKRKGCLLVGFTESLSFYTMYRLKKLELDGLLDYVFSPPDHELPEDAAAESVRSLEPTNYTLARTIARSTPEGERKPNPLLLLDIIQQLNAVPEEVVYLGDNLLKDVLMAQQAGITDVWAEYGFASERPEYELLRQVTHWSPDDVEREKSHTKTVKPTHIIQSMDQLLLIPAIEYRAFCPLRKGDDLGIIVDIWKQVISVQQHFNDLEMRIRQLAVTLMGAVLTGVTLLLRDANGTATIILGLAIPRAALLSFFGIFLWMSFYIMDKFWYHKLLMGAVNQAEFIEKRYARVLTELSLSRTISKASPNKFRKRLIHSKNKIDLFYGLWIVVLLALTVVIIA